MSARTAAVSRSTCQPLLPAWRFPRRGSLTWRAAGPRRSFGGASKTCLERRFGVRHAPGSSQAMNPAAASMSICSAPRPERPRGCGDAPLQIPEPPTLPLRPASDDHRDARRPSRAAATSGCSTLSRRSSIRSASAASCGAQSPPWSAPLPSHRARVRRSQLCTHREPVIEHSQTACSNNKKPPQPVWLGGFRDPTSAWMQASGGAPQRTHTTTNRTTTSRGDWRATD